MAGKIKLYIAETAHPSSKNEPWRNLYLTRLRKAAVEYQGELFSLCKDPQDSDMILFSGDMGPQLEFVRISKLYKKYKSKCFVFSPEGKAIKFVRGMYASIEKEEYHQRRHRPGFYLTPKEIEIGNLEIEPKYLFSFVGSIDTSPVRQAMAKLKHDEGVIEDVSGKVTAAWSNYEDETDKNLMIQRYVESILSSKFVLSPRGYNCSSIRLFESMKLGRAPVIISDTWMAPNGPYWEECSIRVPESDIQEIPKILESYESKWETYGRNARTEWEKWFSDENIVENIVSQCRTIKCSSRVRMLLDDIGSYIKVFSKRNFRHYVRTRIQLYKEFKKIYI